MFTTPPQIICQRYSLKCLLPHPPKIFFPPTTRNCFYHTIHKACFATQSQNIFLQYPPKFWHLTPKYVAIPTQLFFHPTPRNFLDTSSPQIILPPLPKSIASSSINSFCCPTLKIFSTPTIFCHHTHKTLLPSHPPRFLL